MSIFTPPSTTPACVWTSLTLELKQCAVQLMAQLAFNRIADQSGWFTKEPNDVQPTQQPKNPA